MYNWYILSLIIFYNMLSYIIPNGMCIIYPFIPLYKSYVILLYHLYHFCWHKAVAFGTLSSAVDIILKFSERYFIVKINKYLYWYYVKQSDKSVNIAILKNVIFVSFFFSLFFLKIMKYFRNNLNIYLTLFFSKLTF